MAIENSEKQSLWLRFRHWYDSYQGKKVVNIVYSAGASVVIIGALCKILHWPSANYLLMLGMFTEAFLFLIGTLERPFPEFHWENVFPQLLGYGAKPELLEEKANQARPTLLGAGVEGKAQPTGNSTGNFGPVGTVPTLKDEDLKALKNGIENLAKTASQLSELGKVAETGVKLNEKLVAAEAATDSYTAATADLTKLYAQVGDNLQHVADETKVVAGEMKQVSEGARDVKQGVELAGKNLTSLNSVYELQLQTLNEQLAAQQASAKSAKQLEKQVAELNTIYGNMLNALA